MLGADEWLEVDLRLPSGKTGAVRGEKGIVTSATSATFAGALMMHAAHRHPSAPGQHKSDMIIDDDAVYDTHEGTSSAGPSWPTTRHVGEP